MRRRIKEICHQPPRRRASVKLRNDRTGAIRPNQCWSMDFMAAELLDGRRLRLLTIVDNFSRVSPLIGVGFRYQGYDVVAALNLAVAQYGVPEGIRVDHGPEFISKEVDSVGLGPGRGPGLFPAGETH